MSAADEQLSAKKFVSLKSDDIKRWNDRKIYFPIAKAVSCRGRVRGSLQQEWEINVFLL